MPKLLSKNKSFNSFFFVVVLLLQQIGSSILVSFGTLGLIILLVNVSYKSNKRVQGLYNVFIVCQLISIGFFFVIYGQESLYLPREFRIISVLFAFIYLLQSTIKFQINLQQVVLLSSISLLIFVVLQYFFSGSGFHFVIPDYLYAIDDGALASKGLQHSIEHGYKFIFRPSAFFSEPSYLGMVSSCLFYCTFYTENRKQNLISRICIILTVALSSSALGIGGVLLVILSFKLQTKLVIPLIILLFIGVLILSEYIFVGRVDSILSQNDESSVTRFIKPINIIIYNFQHGDFLGIPFSAQIYHFRVAGFYGINDDPPFHNSIMNLIINYGLLGFYILYIFFKVLTINTTERVLLLVVMFQNGSFFDYIKVFTITFILLTVRQVIDKKSKDIDSKIKIA